MLYSIQYLRFWAALLVLLHHVTLSLERDLGNELVRSFGNGVSGVDLFFVISGFIMVHVTAEKRPGAGDFMARRIARVAPPYWVATSALVLVALVSPRLLASTELQAAHMIASYLFVPFDHPQTFYNYPVLHVGWTLNYEMQFYTIFALALLIAPERRVMAASVMLLALAAAGALFHPSSVQLEFWTAPILMEFIYGMLLGVAWHHPALARLKPPAWLGWAGMAIGTAVMLLLPVGDSGHTPAHGTRWLISGLPAALVLASALVLERADKVRKIEWLRLLGDASYALYIWHFFAIGAMRAVWPKDLAAGWGGAIAFIVLVSAVAIAGSVVAYLLIEKPLVRWSGSLLKRMRRQEAVV